MECMVLCPAGGDYICLLVEGNCVSGGEDMVLS